MIRAVRDVSYDPETCNFLLQAGLASFKGGIVIVSHSAPFIASFCKELWIVRAKTSAKGLQKNVCNSHGPSRIEVNHVACEADFDEAYASFTNEILADIGTA